jgi:isoleucyl-tRNA synthetase
LNYAASSWFVEVTKFRDKLVKANKDINWVPGDIQEGRFGKWLEGARDWAISRSRYWGAPLPVWRCDKCGHKEFVDSVDGLKKKTGGRNNFYVVRHGESENNVLGIIGSNLKDIYHLTDKGRMEVKEAADKLKGKKIDLIYVSPFARTQESAKIIAETLNIDLAHIITDARLHEINAGELDGKTETEYQRYFGIDLKKFTKNLPGGENYTQVKNRMMEFIYDINSKNSNKNILIVSHRTPIRLMFAGTEGMTPEQYVNFRKEPKSEIKNSEVKVLPFAPISHNENYELDLHRPYIDEVVFNCPVCKTEEGRMKRVPEVFDCWFESGSMPFAESHYPFENLDKFNPNPGLFRKSIGFPAQFIGEGLDQTRGWFYSMLVLSVALFGESSYKNVVVNGLILAADGKKMSKRLKNYPDPSVILDKYGADALRYYLLSSPVVKAEDLCFSEAGIDEVMKKILTRLDNVYSFYEMYSKNTSVPVKNFVPVSENILDQWLLARLNKLISEVTIATDKYELDRATRPIADFVDDLSTWYLRRSRDRFKADNQKDKTQAIETTRFILEELAKIIAPVMPFSAEELYQKVKSFAGAESVHLASWPEQRSLSSTEDRIITDMIEVRKIVSLGLEVRSKSLIKVRQPLSKLTIKECNLDNKNLEQYLELIKDEVNVKEVFFDNSLSTPVELDLNITPELREEGQVRELIRGIQDLRKQEKLSPFDLVSLRVKTDQKGQILIQKFEAEIKKTTLLKTISYGEMEDGIVIKIEETDFSLRILR